MSGVHNGDVVHAEQIAFGALIQSHNRCRSGQGSTRADNGDGIRIDLCQTIELADRTDNTYHVTFVHAVVVVGASRREYPESNVSVVNGEGYVAGAGRLRIHT
ncbi:MAG: hypothetical protein EBZ21_07760 [Flavobacteriia bacterium]|nr:hypothetical protein [Flavobacteriia bacterium]